MSATPRTISCPKCGTWCRLVPDIEAVRLRIVCPNCGRRRLVPKADTPEHVRLEASGFEPLPGFERQGDPDEPGGRL
jgi:hypothetical protein